MQTNLKKLDQLVSLRGLAAWVVVFYHSVVLLQIALPQLPRNLVIFIAQGYLAVDFFFVLSGFIIFINYHSNFRSDIRHNALKFYWNRISRIYPVHLVMLVAYLLLTLAFLHFSSSKTIPSGYTVESFLQSLILIHAWTGDPTWWNVPSWSISAEWFVYLFFPFIAILFHRFISGLSAHFILATAISIALYSAYFLKGYDSLGTAAFSMALVRVFLEFLLGSVVGSLFVNHRKFLSQSRAAVGAIVLLMCAALPFIDAPNYAVIPFLCFAMVWFLSVDTSPVSKILSNKLLVYLGEISYSTYMVHYFVYDLFKAGWVNNSGSVDPIKLLASFLAVLLLSMLMHRAIEVPAQRYLRIGLLGHFNSKPDFRARRQVD